MLEIRPICENCEKSLAHDSNEAMICSFECTFCLSCVQEVLLGVCPNCGGEFSERPGRPEKLLNKYPVSKQRIYKPVDKETHIKKWNIK
ncbi:DUF1272 domain-containing protein [Lutimonas sp.]|uniref:DUF1272 domain-containing protein n=1 Tax=Lutimonas sp. TaxID=1872403 RepID=UPI003D9BD079